MSQNVMDTAMALRAMPMQDLAIGRLCLCQHCRVSEGSHEQGYTRLVLAPIRLALFFVQLLHEATGAINAAPMISLSRPPMSRQGLFSFAVSLVSSSICFSLHVGAQ